MYCYLITFVPISRSIIETLISREKLLQHSTYSGVYTNNDEPRRRERGLYANKIDIMQRLAADKSNDKAMTRLCVKDEEAVRQGGLD